MLIIIIMFQIVVEDEAGALSSDNLSDDNMPPCSQLASSSSKVSEGKKVGKAVHKSASNTGLKDVLTKYLETSTQQAKDVEQKVNIYYIVI